MSKLKVTIKSAGLLIIVLACIFQGRHCYSATYYRYVDRNGTVCFTDNRQSIPEEYRKKAIKITDEKGNADKKSKDTQIKADNEGGPSTEKKRGLSFTERIKDAWTTIKNSNFFKPAVAIVISLCLFMVIGKIGSFLRRKRGISN